MMPSEANQNHRKDAYDALKRYWGFDSFRSGQWEAISAVLENRDVLAVLTTGGGKSLLYQLPAVLQNGLTLVVSPLIALMSDQVEALASKGIAATCITSNLPRHQIDQAWTDAEYGKYRLLYITPERLQSELFLARADRLKVDLLAVDEAHCISEWGHDFRPAYRKISGARSLLTNANGETTSVIAVTATATPAVRKDIIEQLDLTNPEVIVNGFDRPNLVWNVFRGENKLARTLDILQSKPGSSIIYAGTRRASEQWASTLVSNGIEAEAYHAGLPYEARAAIQTRWQEDRTQVMVATSAFGMGIDKPDVRTVIHVAMPSTIEAYYQEAGRAGRDGNEAYVAMLVAAGDDDLPRSFAEEGHPDVKTIHTVYESVCALARIALNDQPKAAVSVDTVAISKNTGFTPMAVSASIGQLEQSGVWHTIARQQERVLIKFAQSREGLETTLEHFRSENESLAGFIQSLLRTIPATAFTAWAGVPFTNLERATGLPRRRVLDGLAYLEERSILSIQEAGEDLRVLFATPRVAKPTVDRARIEQGRKRARSSLADVRRYVMATTCRRQFLLTYFGESASGRCEACDVCLGRHRLEVITSMDEDLLWQLLDDIDIGLPREDWLAREDISVKKKDGLADWLIEEGFVVVDNPIGDKLSLTPKALRQKSKRQKKRG